MKKASQACRPDLRRARVARTRLRGCLPPRKTPLEWLLRRTALLETNRFGKIAAAWIPAGGILDEDGNDLLGRSLPEYFEDRGAPEFTQIFRTVARCGEEQRCNFQVQAGSGPCFFTAHLQPVHRETGMHVFVLLQRAQKKSLLRYASPQRVVSFRTAPRGASSEDCNLQCLGQAHGCRQERRSISSQMMRVADQERRRFARNLHETVAQTLAAVKMAVGKMGRRLPEDNKEIQDELAAALALTNQAIQEVRTFTHLMHPPALGLGGLVPTLRAYAEGFASRSGIATSVETGDNLPNLDQETEITVFRIVQEALTNVHRHSGSPQAVVRLWFEPEFLRVEVQDFGRGMDLRHERDGKPAMQWFGVGLSGIRERVSQAAGTLKIASLPGKGTVLQARLPVSCANLRVPDGSCLMHRSELRG